MGNDQTPPGSPNSALDSSPSSNASTPRSCYKDMDVPLPVEPEELMLPPAASAPLHLSCLEEPNTPDAKVQQGSPEEEEQESEAAKPQPTQLKAEESSIRRPMTPVDESSAGEAPADDSLRARSPPPRKGVPTPPKPHKARVVWVGNVKPGIHHDELRDIFRVAVQFRPDVRVTHVTVQYQQGKSCNSATVFLNRSVLLSKLQQSLRDNAQQPKLKVRKCKNRRKKQKWVHTEVAATSQPHATAEAAAESYFASEMVEELPAEVGVGTPVFDEFMDELDQKMEDLKRIVKFKVDRKQCMSKAIGRATLSSRLAPRARFVV